MSGYVVLRFTRWMPIWQWKNVLELAELAYGRLVSMLN